MLVSFIIPVYNTPQEKLKACFDSISKVTQISYEVIVIDDGSSVETQRFCIAYVEEHDSFSYIGKENGGVSSARNAGIEAAKGEYVYFVDSDDELVPDVFEKEWFQKNADIVVTDIALNKNNGNHKIADKKQNTFLTACEYVDASLRDNLLFGPYAKFFKLELLNKNNARFDESMLSGEDAVFVFRLMKCRPSIYYTGKVTYIYKYSPSTGDARLRKYPDKAVNDNVRMHKVFLDVIQEISPDRMLCASLTTRVISRFVKQIFNIAADLLRKKQLNMELKKRIAAAIRQFDEEEVKKCSLGIKIRYYIIKKRLWNMLGLIASIRNKYLALKSYR